VKRLALAVAGGLILALTGGCAANNPSPVSTTAANALRPFVQALRVAASGKSIPTVRSKVSALQSEVNTLRQNGDLTTRRAQQIDDAASTLQTDFIQRHPPATPTITPPTSPSSTPDTGTPTPTVTITIPPTSTTPTPTITTSTKAKKSKPPKLGQGNGNGGFPPGQNH
jgi:hypothetical protein